MASTSCNADALSGPMQGCNPPACIRISPMASPGLRSARVHQHESLHCVLRAAAVFKTEVWKGVMVTVLMLLLIISLLFCLTVALTCQPCLQVCPLNKSGHGVTRPRHHAAIVPWYHASMPALQHVSMVPWCHGTFVPWNLGILVPLHLGAMAPSTVPRC